MITAEIEVDRSAEEVFSYATDPARFAEWQKGVVNGHADRPERPAIGDRCVTVRRIGFADRAVTSEIIRVDPPRTWRIRSIDGPIRAVVDVAVEPLAPERARLTIAIDFAGRGVGRLLVPLVVRREARKEMPANLAVLKARLERSAEER